MEGKWKAENPDSGTGSDVRFTTPPIIEICAWEAEEVTAAGLGKRKEGIRGTRERVRGNGKGQAEPIVT